MKRIHIFLLLAASTPVATSFVSPSLLSRQYRSSIDTSLHSSGTNQTTTMASQKYTCEVPPFINIMAANRAEIAVRIMRAATELNIATSAIYVEEDRFSQHRWGADKSFKLTHTGTPISAYLDIEQIIQVAKKAQVDAIHPVSYSQMLQTVLFHLCFLTIPMIHLSFHHLSGLWLPVGKSRVCHSMCQSRNYICWSHYR